MHLLNRFLDAKQRHTPHHIQLMQLLTQETFYLPSKLITNSTISQKMTGYYQQYFHRYLVLRQ